MKLNASVPFEPIRANMLQDPELAAFYLEESLIEGGAAGFVRALRHVTEGLIPADSAGLGLEAVVNLLAPPGLRVTFAPRETEKTFP